MALLEQHPPHVRKRIALVWTVIIAVVLIAVLVVVYTSGKTQESDASGGSKFNDFYKTISDTTQSFFGGK